MKVDVHSHFAPRPYVDALSNPGNAYGTSVIDRELDVPTVVFPSGKKHALVPPLVDPSKKLEQLDSLGFDIAVMSPPLYALHHELNGQDAAEHVRLLNDGLADLQSSNPARFACLGALPIQEPELARTEIDRMIDELGLVGATICANITGRNLDEPEFRPVFAHLAKRKFPLFIHALLGEGSENARLSKYRLFNAIGNPLDATIAIASLIYGGLLDAYPDLTICIAHAGGAAPFIKGRLDRAYEIHPELNAAISHPPSSYLRRLYFDTITHSREALQFLVDFVGADRVMTGSDCPFHLTDMGDPDAASQPDSLNLDSEARSKILGETASELFGLGSSDRPR